MSEVPVLFIQTIYCTISQVKTRYHRYGGTGLILQSLNLPASATRVVVRGRSSTAGCNPPEFTAPPRFPPYRSNVPIYKSIARDTPPQHSHRVILICSHYCAVTQLGFDFLNISQFKNYKFREKISILTLNNLLKLVHCWLDTLVSYSIFDVISVYFLLI